MVDAMRWRGAGYFMVAAPLLLGGCGGYGYAPPGAVASVNWAPPRPPFALPPGRFVFLPDRGRPLASPLRALDDPPPESPPAVGRAPEPEPAAPDQTAVVPARVEPAPKPEPAAPVTVEASVFVNPAPKEPEPELHRIDPSCGRWWSLSNLWCGS
jgi:hypothetical protein